MDGINKFVFGGVDSESCGIIMTEPPPIVFPERDVEAISIPGRSGDILQDNGRYLNVQIPYKCAIIPQDDVDLRTVANNAMGLLRPTGSYVRLEDTYDPNHFRMARISGYVSVQSIVEQAGTFTITFDCMPQRWLKSGENVIVAESPVDLYNPTGTPAKPMITVYGSGSGYLTVGSATVKINKMEDILILDCELQDAYRQVGDGAPENMNGNIYAPRFPELVAGKNAVRWTGGITKVEIIPRWWAL